MGKYRKKPVVIEAWQFTEENYRRDKMPLWLKDSIDKDVIALWSHYGGDVIGGEIKTLEGKHIVSEGDFIIMGIAGEFYPCKPDIFAKTYELVED